MSCRCGRSPSGPGYIPIALPSVRSMFQKMYGIRTVFAYGTCQFHHVEFPRSFATSEASQLFNRLSRSATDHFCDESKRLTRRRIDQETHRQRPALTQRRYRARRSEYLLRGSRIRRVQTHGVAR